MKVAIVSPYATVAPHFEAELDIAQQHLDGGDQVSFLHCLGQLSNCDFNTDRDPKRCSGCRGRREHGLESLSQSCRSREIGSYQNTIDIPQFDSVESLMRWRIENFDIGYAALSSLVSVCRDPEPDLKEHESLLRRFIESAIATWEETIRLIKRECPDRVYVFNGRFAAMRAVFRACQKMEVPCFMHERGCDKDHYDLLENHLPHCLVGIDAAIRRLWDEGDPATRESIGASWFEDRVARIERNWHSFTKGQEAGRLPGSFDASQRNVAIFCSSDDEFVAIGDSWRNDLYPNQVSAIAAIAKSMMTSSLHTQLYLRVHPNLKDVDNDRKSAMMALDFPNLKIITPEAAVDTYALMNQSDLTVTFGSSVGMEAVYWRRPSILLGPCLYQGLPGPIRSRSHQQTVELIGRDHKPAGDITGALMYGHWFQSRGYRYQYFEAESLFEGKFKGQVIHDRDAARKAAKRARKRKLFPLFR